MPHFKDASGTLYFLDATDDPARWLPADCVPISEADADALRNPPKSAEQLANETREARKRDRAAAVAAIVVTTSAGNSFDGDETSQGRMARAIIALQGTGTPTVNWVLSDNTVLAATAAELTEALALAGAAQAALWVIE